MKLFYSSKEIFVRDNRFVTRFSVEDFAGRSPYEVRDLDGNIIVAAAKRLTKKKAQKLVDTGLEWVEYPVEILIERHLSAPIFDEESGEVLFDVVTPLDEMRLRKIIDAGVDSFFIADDLAKGADDSIIRSFIADQESLRLLKQTEDIEDENQLQLFVSTR